MEYGRYVIEKGIKKRLDFIKDYLCMFDESELCEFLSYLQKLIEDHKCIAKFKINEKGKWELWREAME